MRIDKTSMMGALFVVAATAGLWIATGVGAGDAFLYLGYEFLFVIGPGWILFRAISPGTRSPLTQVAFGWPLGLACEVGFFALTAALDAREAFYAYPAVVAFPSGLVLLRRSRPRSEEGDNEGPRLAPRQVWALAGICLFGLAYVGMTLYAQSPIPGTVETVFYLPDSIAHISWAAEALHHWPFELPQLAGVPFNYHYLSHLHLAAASQVTGIEVSVVFMRLYLPPLLFLLVLQLGHAGRTVSGLAWAGPVAAALFIAVSELDLMIPQLVPFQGLKDLWLWASPSFALGLAFMLPATVLVASLIDRDVWARLGLDNRIAAWVLLVPLLLAAGGAKPVPLPLLIGGLAGLLVWDRLAHRSLDRTAVRALGLASVAFLAWIAAVYGTKGGGLALGIGQGAELMPAIGLLRQTVPDAFVVEVAYWGLGFFVGAAFLYAAPLAGLYWVLGRGRPPLGPVQRLLLVILACGLAAWVFTDDDVGNSGYFSVYAITAAAPVIATGLLRGLGELRAVDQVTGRRGALIAVMVAVIATGIALAGWELTLDLHPAQAFVVVYAALSLLLAGVYLGARAVMGGRVAVAAVVATGLVVAILNPLLDTVPETARRLKEDLPLYDAFQYGLTRDDYEGALWLRHNTSPDAVLSISNQTSERARVLAPGHTEIPAFSERRALYEGWQWSMRAADLGFASVYRRERFPYPLRRRLEFRLFAQGNRRALDTLKRKYGVTHLVIDRDDGRVNPRVYGMGELVFANPGMQVIEL